MRRSRGGVYDLPNGRKIAQIQIKGQRFAATYDTDEEAAGWIEAIKRTYAREVDKVEPVHATLSSIAPEWFADRERNGIRVDQERSSFARHIEAHPIAHRPLVAVDTKAVMAWIRVLEVTKVATTVRRAKSVETVDEAKAISRQTAAHALRILKGLLRHAVQSGHIAHNPAAEAKLGRRKKPDEWAWLTLEEIASVLGLDHGDARTTLERRSVYTVAIYAGLRRSEMWSLVWKHVHLDGPRPRIEVRAPLKTPGAFRDIPLLPPAIDVLRAWKGATDSRPERPVWPSATNGKRGDDDEAPGWRDRPYWTVDESGERVRVVTRGSKSRAGISRRVRFHDLRHTYCSHLIQGSWGRTWSLYEVRQAAGHSSIQVTQRYAHLSPDGIHAAAREMREGWEKHATASSDSSNGSEPASTNRPEI